MRGDRRRHQPRRHERNTKRESFHHRQVSSPKGRRTMERICGVIMLVPD
jgi:hypothetical protein